MPKTDRLSGCSGWINLSFVERERTPRQLMEFGIRLHLAGPPLSNIVRKLEKFGIKPSRKAVYDWVHKCDLQPADDENPNHITLDETVIQLDDHHYWLYLPEKHDLDDALFLIDGVKHLQTALRRSGLRF